MKQVAKIFPRQKKAQKKERPFPYKKQADRLFRLGKKNTPQNPKFLPAMKLMKPISLTKIRYQNGFLVSSKKLNNSYMPIKSQWGTYNSDVKPPLLVVDSGRFYRFGENKKYAKVAE